MKYHISLFTGLFLCIFFLTVPARLMAQNNIYLPDISALPETTVSLPVYLKNTSSIVAAQFELTVPQGVTIDETSGTMSNRGNGHSVNIKLNGNSYRVMVFSPENLPVRGNNGILFTMKAHVGRDFLAEHAYDFGMQQVILSDSTGVNVVTDYNCGQLKIEPSPDFIATSLLSSHPSPLTPLSSLPLSYTVKNQGNAAARGGWSEHVMLVGNGRNQLLATFYQDVKLPSGGSVNRQETVIVPQLPGMEGDVQLMVKIVPNSDSGETPEYQDNNTTFCQQVFQLQKKLFTEMPCRYDEANGTITYKLMRSGSWNDEETFTISKQGDSRLQVPATATIKSGQSATYLYLRATDNQSLDNDSLFIITAVGAQYSAVRDTLIMVDNELPQLSLNSSKSILDEGQSCTLTISRPKASGQAQEIRLACEQAERFQFPSTATIPAGKKSVSVEITAKENDEVTDTLSIAFTAMATRHEKGQCVLLLADNDLPDISLELTPLAVSEAAGINAIYGKIRKQNHQESKITVDLSDDSNGRLYYGKQRIVMPAGMEEVAFSIGVVDNATVDGEMDINVKAAIYLSSCGCSASGSSRGSVSQTIRLLDDDGPSLAVVPSMGTMQEGSSDNFLTISRNTTTTSALSVAISSDCDDMLTYNHSVSIPKGKTSANVPLTVKRNDVQGDGRTITFTASANGHTEGTCWVAVSDRTLPDAIIRQFSFDDKSSYEAGDTVEVNVSVGNAGIAPLKAPVKVEILLNGETTLSTYTDEDIPAGGSETILRSIVLPDKPGEYSIWAVVNGENKVSELNGVNNMSEVLPLTITPNFTTTISTDKAIYKKGETVNISGNAIGPKGVQTMVEIYILNEGTRQTISAKTDDNGHFSASFTPYERQAGHFVVGACCPGEGLRTEQASFDIYGLRRATGDHITCETTVGETFTTTIPLYNPGIKNLTGAQVQVLSKPADCQVTMNIPATLKAGEVSDVVCQIVGTASTEGNEWDIIEAKVTTQQGETLPLQLYYYCRSKKGELVASIQSINTTMTKGQSRDYPFTIKNIGKGETGKILLALPGNGWMDAATPREMASLQSGESTTVVLRFTPSDDMPLNVPVTGNIAMNCNNGKGLSVGFSITPVSEQNGTLTVDVCDEYTYYTAEAPHVADAIVYVRNMATGAIVTQGTTDGQGIFHTVLPEGYYNLTVTADKHSSHQSTILIDPGKELRKTVNLSYDAISVDWQVEETTVEDVYNIVTEVEYETNVPEPIIVVQAPDEIPADELSPNESLIYYVVLTNKGLITAQETTLSTPQAKGFTFEALKEGPFEVLPQQSVVIPVKVTRTTGDERWNVNRGRKNADGENEEEATEGEEDEGPDCWVSQETTWFWDCGYDRQWHRYEKPIRIKRCKRDGTGGGGLGFGFSWNNSGGKPSNNTPPKPNDETNDVFDTIDHWADVLFSEKDFSDCEPCQNGMLMTLGECVFHIICSGHPVLSAMVDLYKYLLMGDEEDLEDAGKDGVKAIKDKLKESELTVYNNGDMEMWGFKVEGSEKTSEFFRYNGAKSEMEGYWDENHDRHLKFYQKEYIFKDVFNAYALGKNIWKCYESMQGCFTSLVDNPDKFFDCYDGVSKAIDIVTSDITSKIIGHYVPGSKLANIHKATENFVKMKKMLDEAVRCLKNLYHACDHLNGPYIDDENNDRPYYSPRKAEIDFISSVNETSLHVVDMMESLIEMDNLFWGAEEDWMEVSLQEQLDIIDSVDFATMTFEEALRWKPAELSLSSYRSFFTRRQQAALGQVPTETTDSILAVWDKMTAAANALQEAGYESVDDYFENGMTGMYNLLREKQRSVCASIRLEFPQTMALTRQAFNGTLTVLNGNEEKPMVNARLNLTVTAPDGTVATEHEFQINVEQLEGFEGEKTVGSAWQLGPQQKGTAVIQFIPTKYAAETVPLEYGFGGTLTYTDPYTDLEVTRYIAPVTLTVNPSPRLELNYFMQRDVFGDDPLTTDVIEPSRPAEFSLLISNKGFGDANNVRMTTQKPQIVENEKGLLVDFRLLYSMLNGQEKDLPLGGNIATDFGIIPAHSTAYAQWFFESSLLGHFTDYDIKATHLTGFGNANLSLIDTLAIHELTRTIETKGRRGFLVNDVADADDQPDHLYLTDGTSQPVSPTVSSSLKKNSDTEYELSVSTLLPGWAYASIPDPTGGNGQLVGVTRLSDSGDISLSNCWQTDVTLIDGADPLYEYRLHLADSIGAACSDTYLLQFTPRPATSLKVDSITGLPQPEDIATLPVKTADVWFNKDVDNASLNTQDISLSFEGTALDASKITITRLSPRHYRLTLTSLTAADGFYLLQVQTAGINDTDGYAGANGYSVGWVQLEGGMVRMLVDVWPENSGTWTSEALSNETASNPHPSPLTQQASPTTLEVEFGTKIRLKAQSNNGYNFSNWSMNGQVLSDSAVYECVATQANHITAIFRPGKHSLSILVDEQKGSVYGGDTGLYDHGSSVSLTAYPADGFLLDHWLVNGEQTATAEETIDITMDNDKTVQPVFMLESLNTAMVYHLQPGWNCISVNIESPDIPNIQNWLNSQSHVVQVSGSGGYYDVKVDDITDFTLDGMLLQPDRNPISLKTGWNKLSYLPPYASSLPTVLEGFHPERGDIVCGTQGFAIFDGTLWTGTLNRLLPGHGYRYYTNTKRTASYPEVATAITKAEADMSLPPIVTPNGTAQLNAHDFRYVMTLTGRVEAAYDDEESVIAAFANGQLRGLSTRIDGTHFLPIFSTKQQGDELEFRLSRQPDAGWLQLLPALSFNYSFVPQATPDILTGATFFSIGSSVPTTITYPFTVDDGSHFNPGGITIRQESRGIHIGKGHKYVKKTSSAK